MKKLFSFMVLSILALSISSNVFAANQEEFSLTAEDDANFFSVPETEEIFPSASTEEIVKTFGDEDQEYTIFDTDEKELKKQIDEPTKESKPAVKTTAAKTLAKLPADIKELKALNMRITRHDIVNLKKSLDAKEIGYYTKVLKEGNAEQKRWAKQILYHDARIKKKYKK